MMMPIVVSLASTCILCSVVGAMIVSRYELSGPALASTDVLTCGTKAVSDQYCAARVTNATCEPLTHDWCELKDMSMAGTYMIKRTIQRTIKRMLEVTNITRLPSELRPVPINMTVGSEVEVKFMAHAGWIRFRFDLKDISSNVVFRANVQPNDIRFAWKLDGQSMVDVDVVPLNHYPETEYTLTVRCDVNSFHIYMNGDYIWTYNSTLPVISITQILGVFDEGIPGELYYVAFKTGL